MCTSLNFATIALQANQSVATNAMNYSKKPCAEKLFIWGIDSFDIK